jgi:hypothetical protein
MTKEFEQIGFYDGSRKVETPGGSVPEAKESTTLEPTPSAEEKKRPLMFFVETDPGSAGIRGANKFIQEIIAYSKPQAEWLARINFNQNKTEVKLPQGRRIDTSYVKTEAIGSHELTEDEKTRFISAIRKRRKSKRREMPSDTPREPHWWEKD